MNKLAYMKGGLQRAKEAVRPTRYMKQKSFEDKMLSTGIQFKHPWAQMAHMHDLRVWTLAYAPARKGNVQRLQELHLLNQEMWYLKYMAMWKRVFIGIGLWFFVTRVQGSKYMKKYNNDSHDAHWRDTAAHM